jgi:nucleotide-binding universal stress UspA family protein
MYNTILFPTDGSDGAYAALEHARDVATQYGATLHVLFVAQEDFGPSGMVDTDHEDIPKSDMTGERHDEDVKSGMTNVEHDELGAVEAHGQEVVGEVAQSLGDDIPVETVVLRGNPYERILDYSEENDADLIVMGTHGRTGVDRYLLGSVTEKVVRTSDVPVLTVRMDA